MPPMAKERDAETGVDYFGARYMSAAQGRFTSPDRPFADQFVSNPQSWNLYSYVRNNPLRYVDDTGKAAISALVKNIALRNARRRGVSRAWAAERKLVGAGKPGTRRGGWTAAERQELIDTGKVRDYEGAHINGVAKNEVSMAENPDNIEFLTRDEHFEDHGFDWRNPTIGDLLSRSNMGILPFLQRWDQEERNLTGPSGCGRLCASPDSKWALINPFNNILDFPAMVRAFFPGSPKPRELKPDVHSRICFEDGSCATQ